MRGGEGIPNKNRKQEVAQRPAALHFRSMTAPRQQSARSIFARAIIPTWLVTGAWDFCCATALSVLAYKGTFARLWQGVASAAFGPGMLTAGGRGVAAGIGLHFAVAFTWSAIFVGAASVSPAL